ncbi:CopD family protein [Paenibacillus sediminis]|uniref:Copper resistance protein D n=1 Tax=Paenibacillus sediminis TaxID=664909 RepID=A0ABS4H0C9_9BACL|nr:CopD family protein [Paenibacillus sediminis]MBP1935986.1 putative copper resistance protein D [Paenibacillus sediminis]
MYYWLGEPFLYLCFALLTGIAILNMIPNAYKPTLSIPRGVGFISAVGVVIFSFLPVLRIILFFREDIGFWASFNSVMFSFREGKAYLWTAALSLGSALILRDRSLSSRRLFQAATVLFLVGIVASLAVFNHAASIKGAVGAFTFALHFGAMGIWAGVLLITGWFSKEYSKWNSFLRWFQPLAMLMMFIILGSGIYLMLAVDPEYFNSWMLSYGQALLVKHLLIMPLLVIAFVNGWLLKRIAGKNANFDPRPWAKLEGGFILLIYIVTGYMNVQPTPHDVSVTLQTTNPSKLYLLFHHGAAYANRSLQLTWNSGSILLWLMGLLLLTGVIWLFRQRRSSVTAFICGMLSVAALYCGFMLSIT